MPFQEINVLSDKKPILVRNSVLVLSKILEITNIPLREYLVSMQIWK